MSRLFLVITFINFSLLVKAFNTYDIVLQNKCGKLIIDKIEFKNDNDTLKNYLDKLVKKYPKGVTIENIKEKEQQIKRIIIIRKGLACEYKQMTKIWGGVYYFKNGGTISKSTFDIETKPEKDEPVNEIEIK